MANCCIALELDRPMLNATFSTTPPSKPIQRVGIIGGGQLAWMMADAAKTLGIDLIIQTPSPNDPAVSIARETVFAAISDPTATALLSTKADVITFENEFVNLEALTALENQGIRFYPHLNSLNSLLDKYTQRCFIQASNLPTPTFRSPAPPSPDALPSVLKTRRLGYDGQGTFIVKTEPEYRALIEKIGAENLLLETFIPFERELAVIAARSPTGETVIYPIVETVQRNQVCRWVLAPADISPQTHTEIVAIAHAILTGLDFIGVCGIELFLTTSKQVLINEIAPRTHNSGHYTLDACETSQFEQHLRVVCGLPLGSPNLNCAGALMVNLLGVETGQSDYTQKRQQLLQISNAYLHWYGKSESRPGRKLGHITIRLDQPKPDELRQQALANLAQIEAIWYGSQPTFLG
jgi:5-(carboxyamino)imidazole ribonucleotide synthase